MSNPSQYTVLELSALSHVVTASQMPVALNGSAAFSVDAWVNLHGLGAGASIFMQDGVFNFAASGNTVVCSITGYPTVVSDPQKNPLTEHEWRYICVTYAAGQLRIYIDGAFNAYQGISGTGTSSTKPFMIGHWLQGFVRCVRLYNVQLDADTVMANMYGDPDMSTIAAWFDFTQNPPTDLGPNQLPLTLQNGAAMLTQTPALYLEGTAYAQPLRDEDVNPGGLQTDPYTVQAWVYVEALDHPLQAIFVNNDLEREAGMALMLALNQSGSQMLVVSQRGSGEVAGNVLTSTTTVAPKRWVNVATTYDGQNLAIYIAGVQNVVQPFGPIPMMQLESNLLIGAGLAHGRPSAATSLHGYIARVDVWDRCLSAAEITQYMSAVPALDAPGIRSIYEFDSAPARNMITSHPIGLADGAALATQDAKAAPGAGAEARGGTDGRAMPALSRSADDTRIKQRIAADFSDFLRTDPEFFTRGKARDIAGVEALVGPDERSAARDKIAAAWDTLEDTLRHNPQNLPFAVTHEKVGSEHVFHWHKGGHSHVMYRASTADFDDCTIWKVSLVLIVIGAILDLFFGVRIQASASKATRYIIEVVLRNPKVSAFLALGTAVTAVDILGFGRTLFDFGILRELVRIVLNLGFWALVRIVAKLILKLFVTGAALIEVIASLVASIALFVAAYLQKPASCNPPPSVSLSAIRFNHDTTSSSNSAFNIRKNFTRNVDVPEWDPTDTRPEDAPAAYAIQETTGHTITIQARFAIGTASNVQMQMQALGGGILGAIDPITVTFRGGTSNPAFVTIPLNHQTIAAAGVSRQDITWTWQYRPASGGNWTTMATTHHRIYTVLKVPSAPWTQAGYPGNTQLPWTDVLDYACVWAAGAKTYDSAAAAVTTKVNQSLGLKYDMSSGASVYVDIDHALGLEVFLCTQFVRMLAGGVGKGKVVNCTDCATIVATFANILGCELNESTMAANFQLNQIIAIGQPTWGYPNWGSSFSYHEVAWMGANSYTSPLYDACLQVDSSSYPWTWPGSGHTPVLPLKMTFTTQGISPPLPIPTPFTSPSYRERLCANSSAGIGACVPDGPWPDSNAGRRRVQ
jgi:hypothetical protein